MQVKALQNLSLFFEIVMSYTHGMGFLTSGVE